MNNVNRSNRYDSVSSVMQMYEQQMNKGRTNPPKQQNQSHFNSNIKSEGVFVLTKFHNMRGGLSPSNGEKKYFVQRLRKKSRQHNPNQPINDSKGNVNLSQETIKFRPYQNGSGQKYMINSKQKKVFKSPQWLKHRKKAQNITQSSKIIKLKPPIETGKLESQISISYNLKNDQRNRCQSNAQLRQSHQQNQLSMKKSGIYSKWNKSATNKQKIQYLEFQNVRLQQQIKQLKYKFENVMEDNNILLGRMQTLQVEISICQKKLNDSFLREDHHKSIQQKLRLKIQDLQGKLLLAKDQINCKNQGDLTTNEGIVYLCPNDRQVVNMKNQQISRLNQIINKTRNKVNQLNHQLSQQRMKNLQQIIIIQNKYQNILTQNQHQIKQLKQYINQRSNILAQKPRYATETSSFRRAQQQFMKRIASNGRLH